MAHNSELPIDPCNVPTGELFTKAHATYLHAQALVKEGHAESLDALPATVHADIEGARASLLICADRGHAKASFILAEMAEEGCGEERDDKRALEFYERAALQGDSEAQLAYAASTSARAHRKLKASSMSTTNPSLVRACQHGRGGVLNAAGGAEGGGVHA